MLADRSFYRLLHGMIPSPEHYTATLESAMASSTDRRALAPDVSLREVWAWSMYDFANSGYTTVVTTAVFSAYFVAGVARGAPWATFAWTAALSVSYAAIVLSGPLVGAWADAHAAKKPLLLATTVGCVVFTALLWFAAPGAVVPAVILIILSNYFYGLGENLIAAFLPELADSRAMGRVSGWGWSFGYLGGLFSLGLCLVYISWAQKHGQPASSFVPATMLITAALFALTATPTFLYLRERAQPVPGLGHPFHQNERGPRGFLLSPVAAHPHAPHSVLRSDFHGPGVAPATVRGCASSGKESWWISVAVASPAKGTREFSGRTYVLEEGIVCDFALVRAAKGDTHGNLVFHESARNFNPLCAMAGILTIAEVEELVQPGELDPDTAAEIFNAFRPVNAELGATVVIVTHDPTVAG